MSSPTILKLCRGLPGATESIQWGNDRVFKVGGKMFCCMGEDRGSRYSFKVDDERFLELTDLPGIDPAPYLARARWVQVDPDPCKLSESERLGFIKRSYELVFAKLTKKMQRSILADG